MKTLTVKKLKKIIKHLPPNTDVVLIDENLPTKVMRVTQVGLLSSDYEDNKAVGLASLSNIPEVTGLCEKFLFNGRDKNETEKIS